MNILFPVGKEIHALSADEAQDVLREFLKIEQREFSNIKIDNISLDFSQNSVSCALRYIVQTAAKFHKSDDEFFNLWCTRLGYYFGESLCRASSQLSWGIGESGTAFENHPVVRGFRSGEEAAVITICMNLMLAITLDGAPATRADDAIDHWFEMAKD